MQWTKTNKFLIATFGGTLALLFFISQTQNVAFDWNGMFNGTIQTVIAFPLSVALTIWVYRLIYHRGSKK